jgi:predicted transcriptional regulator
VILGDSLERQLSRLNLKLKQERNRFIIILGIGHASGIKSSKLETIVHLPVLLGHILREVFLGIVKEDRVVGCEDERLSYSVKILKLWDGILISLKRLIKNLELFKFPSLKELLKRFQMLLQLIIIQRNSRIVGVN